MGGFIRQRQPVSRWPALENIADLDFFALQAARRDNAIQKLARRADKRLALSIFVRSRRLADKADFRVQLADAKDRLRPRARQLRAACTFRDSFRKNGKLLSA